jgi:hypothetical protein
VIEAKDRRTGKRRRGLFFFLKNLLGKKTFVRRAS